MSGSPFIAFYCDDWLAGTQELTLEAQGALVKIMALIGSTGQRPEYNLDRLSRRFGVTKNKTKKILDELIETEKITIIDNTISNKRAEIELKKSQKLSEKQSDNAKKRWEKFNKNNDASNATASPRLCKPEPEPDIEKEIDKSISKKKTKKRSQIPSRWVDDPTSVLNESNLSQAINNGMTKKEAENETHNFVNHHKAHGKLMADWNAAWRTWCGNWKKFSDSRKASNNVTIRNKKPASIADIAIQRANQRRDGLENIAGSVNEHPSDQRQTIDGKVIGFRKLE